ncbi:cache domain-containing protein [Skermanella sp. TT6]|uniref:Cache domain-containing protein n=1 Tax=Skermanella cutis TaxID=2775420 RepID=A0ABX7B7N3_9PROT|nr:cache domain-containing protein [Skermanella sp. TT6]QQP89765.1 cache domain-containing protein [Skermanella sp. TT6]
MRLLIAGWSGRIALVGAILLMLTGVAGADPGKPTRDEVEALTLKAAALIESQGIEAAREAFNRAGEFRFGEIYVNVIDFTGTWLAYPPRPAGVGQNVVNLKDADGRFMVKDILKVAQESGHGWVSYRWLNPVSNRIEPKTSFVKRVPGKDLVAYIGIYE